MKIVVENVTDGESIPYPVLFLKGRVENLDLDTLKEISTSTKHPNEAQARKLFLTHHTETGSRPVRAVKIIGGKFKILVKLLPGSNLFEFEFCRIIKHFNVLFEPPSTEWHPHRIALIYIIAANSDGSFQAPAGTKNDSVSACKRLSLAGALIQTFLADSLDAHGLSSTPGRKTIQFTGLPGNSVEAEPYFPPVLVHRTKLTMEKAHQMSSEQLWEFHAKELVSLYQNQLDCLKFLAITNVTRYCNPKGIEPKDASMVLSLTKGHVALGGGGLGLFGSGCLYTWSENLDQVQECLLDAKKVDTKMFMDDSAYRGTLGGCYSTTLGGLVHELGHMLDLGHTENGIMSRGCDDVDKFFTISSNTPNAAAIAAQTKRHLLSNCSRQTTYITRSIVSPLQEATAKTTIKREGSSYLEEYQRKKYYRKMVQDCGGAFWNRSSAIILSCHKWLNPSDTVVNPEDITFDEVRNTVTSEYQITIIEFRDTFGSVIKFIEPDAEARSIELDRVFRENDINSKSVELVIANSNLSIFKRKF